MPSKPNDGRNGSTIPDPTSGVCAVDLRGRLDELLDGYRTALHDSLDGLGLSGGDPMCRWRSVASVLRA